MFDPEQLLGSIVGQAMGGVFGGRGGGRKSMFRTGNLASKASLGIGALGIAMAAYEHYSSRNQQPSSTALPASPPPPASGLPPAAPGLGVGPTAPPPPPPPTDLSSLSAAQSEAVLLIRAMIAAAGADGVIDAEERQRILARTSEGGLDAASRGFLEAELAVPRSADEIGAMTPTALVNEVYAAALLALNLDSESERQFLDRLAGAIGLGEQARADIHQQLLA